MVKRILNILVCVGLFLVSCQDDMGLPTLEPQGDYRIVASTESGTRVNIDGAVVTWGEYDQIELVEVDDAGKAVGDFITFQVDDASISEDGKVADFYGADLQVGKKYMAICTYALFHSSSYEGAVRLLHTSSNPLFTGGLSYAKNRWTMTTSVFEVAEGKTPTLNFKNRASMLTLRMRMDSDVAETFALKNIEVSAPVDMFCMKAEMMPGNQQVIGGDLGNTIGTTYKEDHPTISSEEIYEAYLYFMPNDRIDSVSGNFRISMYTTDYRESMVEVPAKMLEAGMSYYKDLTFATPEESGAPRDSLILVDLYNQTGGKDWDDNENWLSDKPIGEWDGVVLDPGGRVRELKFYWNNMTGSLPASIGGLEKLEVLDLMFNSLTGELPKEMGQLSNLRELDLVYNNFEGAIPKEFGNLTRLKRLYISNCMANPSSLTSAPKELGNLRNLETLVLESQDHFGQSIPEEWCGMVNLRTMRLSGSGFTGEIPTGLGDLPNLKVLDLQDNKLSGSVPESLIQVEDLTLRANNLTGMLPHHFYRDQERWNMLAWRVVVQNDGFGFENTFPPVFVLPTNITTIDDKVVNTDELYRSNKLTLILTFNPRRSDTYAVMELLKDLDSQYADSGLGIISGSGDSKEELISYVAGQDMPGLVYEITDENVINYASEYYGYCLVDTAGTVLFSDKLYSYEGNVHDRAMEFVEEYLGGGAEQYESTDFSADGEVMTLQEATVGNGIDVVFMGDGFVDKDMGAGGEYERRMKEAMDAFFSEEPYRTFRNRFNAYAVKAVSLNEGVGGNKKTVFESKFGAGTRVMGDTEKTGEYAKKVPEISSTYDVTVVVVVNSYRSAGTCFMSSTGFSSSFCAIIGNDNESFSEVVRHEAGGHGFAKLADEYTHTNRVLESDDVEKVKDYQERGWYLNVDFTDNPDEILWSHFLKDDRYDGLVGIYEGAYFCEKDAYRSTYNSIMRYNTGGFNAPSRQIIYKNIMELSGDEYTYEKFLEYDAINRTPAANARRRAQSTKVDEKNFVPFAPPVIID